MSRLSLSYLRLFILLAAMLLCIAPAVSVPSPDHGKDDRKDNNKGNDDNNKNVIRVKHGQSIQDAINRAKPYTCIEVEGDHSEQVTISKDGISLIGKGAKLSPPGTYDTENYCFGLSKNGDNPSKNVSAGICIHGRQIKLAPSYKDDDGHWKVESVGDPVKDVRVSGFEITGFDGQNIAVYGGKNTKVSRNKLRNGGRYGFLTVGSRGTLSTNNIVIGSAPTTLNGGPIAMCMDDLSPAEFSYNDISDYFIGLCTETSGGVNKKNNIQGCCLSNVIDPLVTDAKSVDNQITKWNQQCAGDSAIGILLLGAQNALVTGNKIDLGFTTGLPTGQGTGGVVLVDVVVPKIPSIINNGNTIKYNVFGQNDADIFDISMGKNNIRNNVCDRGLKSDGNSSVPVPEYCS